MPIEPLVFGNIRRLSPTPVLVISLAYCERRTLSMELRVGGKFRLGRKIGSGSFGDIYLGESTVYICSVCAHPTSSIRRIWSVIHVQYTFMVCIIPYTPYRKQLKEA